MSHPTGVLGQSPWRTEGRLELSPSTVQGRVVRIGSHSYEPVDWEQLASAPMADPGDKREPAPWYRQTWAVIALPGVVVGVVAAILPHPSHALAAVVLVIAVVALFVRAFQLRRRSQSRR